MLEQEHFHSKKKKKKNAHFKNAVMSVQTVLLHQPNNWLKAGVTFRGPNKAHKPASLNADFYRPFPTLNVKIGGHVSVVTVFHRVILGVKMTGPLWLCWSTVALLNLMACLHLPGLDPSPALSTDTSTPLSPCQSNSFATVGRDWVGVKCVRYCLYEMNAIRWKRLVCSKRTCVG